MSVAPASPPEAAAPQSPDAFAARLAVGDGVMRDIEAYRDRLAEANTRMNLVGPSAMAQFWPRHAFDSAQLHLHAPTARSFIDIGSGAGLPGVILAILLKPLGGHVHLIESVAKRCGFLRDVVADLALPASVHHGRAEALGALRAEVVTARACAPLVRLLDYASPFMAGDARGLFLKGATVDAEIVEARSRWSFTAELTPSLSDPHGRVVSLRGLRRA